MPSRVFTFPLGVPSQWPGKSTGFLKQRRLTGEFPARVDPLTCPVDDTVSDPSRACGHNRRPRALKPTSREGRADRHKRRGGNETGESPCRVRRAKVIRVHSKPAVRVSLECTAHLKLLALAVADVCRQGYCSGYQCWTRLPSGLLLGASVLDLFAVRVTARGINVGPV